MTPLVVAAILGVGTAAVLGLATAAVSAPRSHPAKRCHRRRHHRRCTPRHPKPPKPKPPKPKPPGSPPTTPSPSGPLPSRLEVDENDQGQPPQPYSLRPSHNPVASGAVQFNIYNFGQDPHTFAILDSGGHQLAFAEVPADQPQTSVPVTAHLPPGTYRLECTLPGHASLGMVATLTVK